MSSLIYVYIEKLDSKIIIQCMQNKEKDDSQSEINTQIKIYCYNVDTSSKLQLEEEGTSVFIAGQQKPQPLQSIVGCRLFSVLVL